MIGANLQSIAVSQFDIPFIAFVNTVAALCSLQIDIRHLRVLAYRFPEHLSLIVRQVNAVNVATGVLT